MVRKSRRLSGTSPLPISRRRRSGSFSKGDCQVRQKLGMTCPLYIDGVDRMTADISPSVNPADPHEVIAFVCQAGKAEAEEAIEAARRSFDAWRETPPVARAEYLLAAASWMTAHRHELAAWQVLEIGKQWDQASADVAEAIDFLEYYARRDGAPRRAHGSSPRRPVKSITISTSREAWR